MTISSPGLGSNLDVTSIVSQLMSIEKKPLIALQSKEAGIQTKISALGSLSSAFSSLQAAASALVPSNSSSPLQLLSAFNTTVADTSIATVTADAKATPGSYTLEVSQLAQQHRILTSAQSSPFIKNSDGNTVLTTGGTLTLTLDTKTGTGAPSKVTDINIEDGATIESIKNSINAANAGVTATVINGKAGKQLAITSESAGADQYIRLSGITNLTYDPTQLPTNTDKITQYQAAQGSIFKLNGIEIEGNSNTVTTAVDGLTINLLKTTSTATNINITRDNSKITNLATALVKAFNDAHTTVVNLGSYNPTTKAAGALNGDSTLRTSQNMLRSIVTTVPSELKDNDYTRLSDIGISMQKDGSLSIDTSKLNKAISSNVSDVATLLSAYGKSIKTATDNVIGSEGLINSRTTGLNSSVKLLTSQEEAFNRRLALIEAKYTQQFNALDTLMSKMTSTSAFLTEQLP